MKIILNSMLLAVWALVLAQQRSGGVLGCTSTTNIGNSNLIPADGNISTIDEEDPTVDDEDHPYHFNSLFTLGF